MMSHCITPSSYEHLCLVTSIVILSVGIETRSIALIVAASGSIAMRGDRCLYRRQCGVRNAARPWLLCVDQCTAACALIATMTQSSNILLRRSACASFVLFIVAEIMNNNVGTF